MICCPGSYYSPRCLAGVCHHGPRELTYTEELTPAQIKAGKKPKKTYTSKPRVMPCPVRKCRCARGEGFTVLP